MLLGGKLSTVETAINEVIDYLKACHICKQFIQMLYFHSGK